MPEMFLILAIAIIVIGPKKLPDLAKTVGRAIGELKKAASDFKESISIDDEINDVKSTLNNVKSNNSGVADSEKSDEITYNNYSYEKQAGKLSEKDSEAKKSNDIKEK